MPSILKERGRGAPGRVRAALSGSHRRGQGGWIRSATKSMCEPMFKPVRIALLVVWGLLPATSALAATDLDVLPQGQYGCWTAGIASGPAVTNTPPTFTIIRGSSYQSATGGGTYLLASDLLTFTRGPLKDMRLRRDRDGFWRQIARDGEPGRLKCSRRSGVPLA